MCVGVKACAPTVCRGLRYVVDNTLALRHVQSARPTGTPYWHSYHTWCSIRATTADKRQLTTHNLHDKLTQQLTRLQPTLQSQLINETMELIFIIIQLILSLFVFGLLTSEVIHDLRGHNQTQSVKVLSIILSFVIVILWLIRVFIL